jgi:tubulin--tyrosine ligase
VLITTICGSLHAYWYKEGYLRTCCKEFNYDPQNIYGHLTNDAVQKKHKDYGKY